MTDLKQDLTDIAAALPGLPGAVEELHREARALGDAVADLTADLGAARAELGGALRSMGARLEALRLEAEAHEKEVTEAAQKARSAWDAAREGLQEAGERIDDAASALEEKRLAQEREAKEGAVEVTAAWSGGERAVERLRSEVKAGEEKIEGATDAAREHAEALRTTVEDGVGAVGEDAVALDAVLRDIGETTSDQALFVPGDMMSGCIGDHQTDLEAIAVETGERAGALREQAEAALRDVLTPLAAAREDVVKTIGSLTAEEVLASRAGAEAVPLEEQRGKLLGTVQLLDEEAANLPAVMHQVEISAQLTGLP
jgi:hypothetical protein